MNSENVPTNVDKIRKHSQYQRDKHRVQNNTSPKGNQCCGYCGKMRHESRDRCPAKRSECSNCKKVGHWAACCRQKQRIDTTNPTTAMDRILVLDVIGNKQRRRAPRINVDVHHKADDSFITKARATPDTGAEATVAGLDFLKQMKIEVGNICAPPDDTIVAANGTSIECIGTIDVHIHVANRSTKETVLICTGQQGLLLAWYVCRDLGIIPNDYPKQVCAMKHTRSQLSPPKNGAEQHVHAIAINSSRMTLEDDIEDTTNHLPSQQREPLTCELPTMVFEDVSADFFSYAGRDYLVYVDRLSGWPVTFHFAKGTTTSRHIINACRRAFVALGVPVRFRSDGAPQFASREFIQFLKRWGVNTMMPTSHNPQYNGRACTAVKAMMKLIAASTVRGKLDDGNVQRGLLEYRNTPREGGLSPAQILFGHPLRSAVPAHRAAFSDKWQKTANECVAAVYTRKTKIVTTHSLVLSSRYASARNESATHLKCASGSC